MILVSENAVFLKRLHLLSVGLRVLTNACFGEEGPKRGCDLGACVVDSSGQKMHCEFFLVISRLCAG